MKKLVFAAALWALASIAHAASLDEIAAEAQASQAPAVTVWVASTWGLRKQGSAKDLNEAHRVFAARGFEVVSVESYIENGDLEGFFVTYRRR